MSRSSEAAVRRELKRIKENIALRTRFTEARNNLAYSDGAREVFKKIVIDAQQKSFKDGSTRGMFDLQGLQINDGVLNVITTNFKDFPVVSLNLANNQITQQGLENLFASPSAKTLRMVNLAYNNIDDKGAELIAKQIEEGKLAGVNLMGNQLTDKGVLVIYKAAANAGGCINPEFIILDPRNYSKPNTTKEILRFSEMARTKYESRNTWLKWAGRLGKVGIAGSLVLGFAMLMSPVESIVLLGMLVFYGGILLSAIVLGSTNSARDEITLAEKAVNFAKETPEQQVVFQEQDVLPTYEELHGQHAPVNYYDQHSNYNNNPNNYGFGSGSNNNARTGLYPSPYTQGSQNNSVPQYHRGPQNYGSPQNNVGSQHNVVRFPHGYGSNQSTLAGRGFNQQPQYQQQQQQQQLPTHQELLQQNAQLLQLNRQMLQQLENQQGYNNNYNGYQQSNGTLPSTNPSTNPYTNQ